MANGRDTGGLFKPPPQQQHNHHQHQQQQQQQLAMERKQQSNHLLLLQKEIKEEEEEIFADINSFINSSSNSLYYQDDEQDEQLEETADDERSRSSSGTGHTETNNNQQFSTDSEQTAFSEEEQLNYQAIQAVIQQVQSNLPKPCVFFLEGNCRRSDCKYSHDLSNITCKYWIEGFCFKGEQCPFQHSYSIPNDFSLYDAKGQILDPKQQLNPTFVIESEADFPSLPFDTPPLSVLNEAGSKRGTNANPINTELEHQILSSNSAVVFKTVKKKRKRG